MVARLRPERRRLLLNGASGDGKTHMAKHTALALTDDGQVVLWIDADDYQKDRLRRSLSHAVGPFSIEKVDPLLAMAAEAGTGITLVIDALEKCPHPGELLKQLHALQQQYPVSVLVTTALADGTEQLSATERINLASPVGEERARLATAYGISDGVADSGEYRTRYDITLAAQVATDLTVGATTTDVLDSYIRRRAQTETVRVGLRCLAAAMDDGVRTAMPIAEAMLTLRRCPPLAATPSAIDDTLASPLVTLHQGRLRFVHESLGRFLAAEHLVLSTVDGTNLAQLLAQPTHHELQHYAIHLEREPVRLYDTIRHLADWLLLSDAARGKFGEATAKYAQADITELLVQAAAVAREATLTVTDPSTVTMFGTWSSPRRWSPIDRAMLAAAGHCVRGGLFLHEIGALMDGTDVAMRASISALRAGGSRAAVSTVVGSTFAPFDPGTDAAPASIVAHAARVTHVFGDSDTAEPTATLMWKPNPHCYGRLYMAALLSHPVRHPDDAEHLPDLVETGLAVGGFHLRLELLQAAMYGCTSLKGHARQRMIDVLQDYTPQLGDWATSTSLIEALAGYDEIDPLNSLEDIQESLADALADQDDADNQSVARTAVSNMFEDERILGPFSEAIGSLSDDQRLTLYAMSVLAPGMSIHNDFTVRHLADAACGDGIVASALAVHAGAVPPQWGMVQEEAAAHLQALRGWAKISSTLPPKMPTDPDHPQDPAIEIAWRLVDELLLALLRGEPDHVRAEEIWQQLSTELPIAATCVLADVNSALLFANYSASISGEPQFIPHQVLLAAYPEQIRRLLEWALGQRDQFGPARQRGPWSAGSYIVRTLAVVGTADTADLLRHHYIHDDQVGGDAVAAVHAIDARLQT